MLRKLFSIDNIGCFLVMLASLAYAIATINIYLYSPDDYQQGKLVKIMYVHVPCAWMALSIYCLIGISSIGYIIWRNQLLDIIARKSATMGFCFSVLTLITGSIWGKPIWGTWWVWDARLTSMLILAFLYLGYIALCRGVNKSPVPSDAPAILAIVGMINIPIIKWSVNLWTTLHQPASILRLDGPSIHPAMLLPLLLMFIGSASYFFAILILQVKCELLQRKILRSRHKSLEYTRK